MPKTNHNNRFAKSFSILFLSIFLLAIILFQIPKKSPYYQHYYFLSKSLLRGKLDVTDQLKANFKTPPEFAKLFDYAFFKNRYFLHLGLFPAIIGIPLTPLGPEKYSLALVIFALVLNIIFLRKLTHHFLGEKNTLVTLLLLISSPLLTALVWKGPWYLTALLVSGFGLSFIWYYLVKEKALGILFIIPLFLTRPPALFYSLIPLFSLLSSIKERKKKFILLALTLTTTFTIFALYNYLRFGSALEMGYKYAKAPAEEYRNYRSEETITIKYIKKYFLSNAIYMLVNPLQPRLNKALRFVFPYFELSRFGVGLIFVIPWFLPYLLFNSQKRQDKPYLLTILAILMIVLSVGAEGSFQIGPRYACDFLPLLMFINLKWLGKNKKYLPLFKKLLYLSFFLNLYFFLLVQLGHVRRV